MFDGFNILSIIITKFRVTIQHKKRRKKWKTPSIEKGKKIIRYEFWENMKKKPECGVFVAHVARTVQMYTYIRSVIVTIYSFEFNEEFQE